MAEKNFIVDCEPGQVRYRVRFQTGKDRVLEFVVQLECRVGENWRPVVRYDTAHGFAHRDSYDPAGNVTPHQPMGSADYNSALTYALNQIRDHWRELTRPFREVRQ